MTERNDVNPSSRKTSRSPNQLLDPTSRWSSFDSGLVSESTTHVSHSKHPSTMLSQNTNGKAMMKTPSGKEEERELTEANTQGHPDRKKSGAELVRNPALIWSRCLHSPPVLRSEGSCLSIPLLRHIWCGHWGGCSLRRILGTEPAKTFVRWAYGFFQNTVPSKPYWFPEYRCPHLKSTPLPENHRGSAKTPTRALLPMFWMRN